MPADILIYAVVAAGLVFWLRSLLGTRSGDERQQRPNPLTSRPETLKKQQPAPEMAVPGAALIPEQVDSLGAELERHMSISGAAAERGLLEIARAERGFLLPQFLRGAQDAFVMVIEAFAAGDKDTLRDLLAPSVFSAFEKIIDQRAASGEKASVEIHAVRKTEVTDAQVRDKTAYITVRFTADETSIVRDRDGAVIFGDPERVTETIDLWTFGRPLRSRDPAWLVYRTREDEGDTLSGSTVPATTK